MRRLLFWGVLLCSTAAFAQGEVAPPPPLPPPPPPIQDVAAPPLPREEAPPPTSSSDEHAGFSARIGVGGTYRSLYGITFGGAELDVMIGGQTRKHIGFYLDLGGFVGATEFGLVTSNLQLGFYTEGEIGRLRLGGGILFGGLLIRRVTNDSTIFDFTVGPALQGSFDIVRWDGHGFYVFAKAGVDWLVMATNDSNTGTPLMGRLTGGLGVRY